MADFFNSKIIRQEYECRERTTHISIFSSSDRIEVTGGDVPNVRISYVECPGKHEYSLSEQGGNISLSSTSGAIKGTIVGKQSDYTIDTHTTTGSNNLSGSGTVGSRKLSAHTTSGSVKISFIS